MHIAVDTFLDAVKTMRACGQGRRECVVFLVEHADDGVLRVLHPEHGASSSGFELDQRWLGAFAVRQTHEQVHVQAQVHTHPGSAFHSATDDMWPMVGTVGFLSIVVPRFGNGRIQTDEIYACRLDIGGWQDVDFAALLQP